MSQLLIHLWGDYILQSDWMATYKTKDSIAAFAHALMYSSFFILLRPSLTAWLVICGTHFLIDRFRLARYVVWAKNWIAPREAWIGPTPRRGLRKDLWERGNTPKYADGSQFVALRRTPPWEACQPTGYPTETMPAWMSVWLLIIADNILHLTINAFALKYL